MNNYTAYTLNTFKRLGKFFLDVRGTAGKIWLQNLNPGFIHPCDACAHTHPRTRTYTYIAI